jgi:uncharacterized protein involved in outer membrane biogenesis
MRLLFRWVFRIVLGLIILAVAVTVAILLLLDTITRELLVSRLRSETGMEVKISAVHVGLLSPTISMEGFKLYNTANFGGSVCMDMPELHIEYDVSALRARQLHLTLLRLELAELSVTLDKHGRNNFDGLKLKNKESARHKNTMGKLKFTGIDVLNVTLGKFHLSDLASGHGEEIDFGIKNQILRHVQTEADLAPLGLIAVSHGKASSPGSADADLSQLFNNLFKAP